MLMTVDEEGKMLPVPCRVGQAVDVVAQAGKPKTITGFQTHNTPVGGQKVAVKPLVFRPSGSIPSGSTGYQGEGIAGIVGLNHLGGRWHDNSTHQEGAATASRAACQVILSSTFAAVGHASG
jgi:hypothetical protein